MCPNSRYQKCHISTWFYPFFQKKYKIETEVENWIQKYDQDMGDRQVGCALNWKKIKQKNNILHFDWSSHRVITFISELINSDFQSDNIGLFTKIYFHGQIPGWVLGVGSPA
jgi:hypothetical protein